MRSMFPAAAGSGRPRRANGFSAHCICLFFSFFLNFAILTYFPALGFPLTEPRG